MALTHDEIRKLEAPLPLEAGHEVRVAESFSQDTKARWLAYTTEGPVTARLTEVDPEWQLRNVQIVIGANSATVAQEMVVCGVARTGVGGASPKKSDTEVDHDVVKAAATDSLKRAARLFGVGAYLLDAPRIVTDWKPKPPRTWQDEQTYAKQAFAQFARWYQQKFGDAPRTIDGDTGEVTRPASERAPETDAPHGAELPPAAQERASEYDATQDRRPLSQATLPQVQQWIMGKYPNVKTTSHASNTITKALQEEGKLTEQGGWSEVFGKGFAVAAVAKAVDRYESAEGNAPAEQPPLSAPRTAGPAEQPPAPPSSPRS